VSATPTARLVPPLRFAPWKNGLAGAGAHGDGGGWGGPQDSQQSVGPRADPCAWDETAPPPIGTPARPFYSDRVTGLKVAVGPGVPSTVARAAEGREGLGPGAVSGQVFAVRRGGWLARDLERRDQRRG
jgi:hypothetical protein